MEFVKAPGAHCRGCVLPSGQSPSKQKPTGQHWSLLWKHGVLQAGGRLSHCHLCRTHGITAGCSHCRKVLAGEDWSACVRQQCHLLVCGLPCSSGRLQKFGWGCVPGPPAGRGGGARSVAFPDSSAAGAAMGQPWVLLGCQVQGHARRQLQTCRCPFFGKGTGIFCLRSAEHAGLCWFPDHSDTR